MEPRDENVCYVNIALKKKKHYQCENITDSYKINGLNNNNYKNKVSEQIRIYHQNYQVMP